MLDDIKYRLQDALGVMFSDIGRLAGVFLLGLLAIGVFLGLNYAPTLTLGATGHTVQISCAGVGSPLIIPFITFFQNSALALTQVQCTVTGNIGIVALWYLELQAIIFLGILLAIVALQLSG